MFEEAKRSFRDSDKGEALAQNLSRVLWNAGCEVFIASCYNELTPKRPKKYPKKRSGEWEALKQKLENCSERDLLEDLMPPNSSEPLTRLQLLISTGLVTNERRKKIEARNDVGQRFGWMGDEILNVYGLRLQTLLRDQGIPVQVCSCYLGSELLEAYATNNWNTRMETWQRYALKTWPPIAHANKLLPAKLLFPFNIHSNHWVLVSVDVANASITYHDSLGNDPRAIEGAGKKVNIFTVFKQFLQFCQGGEKKKWTPKVATTPRQNNSDDCGFCVCETMKHVALNWNPSLVDMSNREGQLRRRIAVELVHGIKI